MILAQAYETNLDRLRRYAAFSCGSEGLGDGVVSEALEDVLTTVSSAENANLIALFQKLDATLRNTPHGEGSMFAELGRWRQLTPRERRVIMLYILEGFSSRDVVRITGMGRGEVKAIIARARMIYADRFPVRIGLIGGDAELRETIEAALMPVGHRLLWAVTPDEA
ncbi:sigma factor-like helix-turn-helix DNA-binding protein, partial [Hyphomonas adhaerens]